MDYAPIAPGVEPVDEALVTLVARELSGPKTLAALVDESKRLADTDGLTGLMNRRAFLQAMTVEVPRAERYDYPLSLLMLDVDHFKAIHDRHGHAVGDRVLTALGAMLGQERRASDLVTRWGGEEFILGLTSTDAAGSLVAGERIRACAEAMDVRTDSGERVPVTVSVGCATRHAGEELPVVIDRADRAIYRAKQTGRNRVLGSEETSEVAAGSGVVPAVGAVLAS